jgi:hypothetical protein
VRLALRILALVSLTVFGLSLILDVTQYLSNPCPLALLFKFYVVLFGVIGILPTLVGSALAAWTAAMRRRWGWLAGLLVASGVGVVFLYGAALDDPVPVVEVALTTLSGAFDHTLSLTTCGSGSSHFVQAAVIALVLLAAPLTLLSYSVSRASAVAGRSRGTRLMVG